jgi:hypothetical protein
MSERAEVTDLCPFFYKQEAEESLHVIFEAEKFLDQNGEECILRNARPDDPRT